MNTDDIRPDDNSEMGPGDRKLRLRKEAMIFEQPRQAIGLLAAACTLVGVIVGFSMGLLANRTSSCHHPAAPVGMAPARVVIADTAPGFLGVQISTGMEQIDSGADAEVRVKGARVMQVIPGTPAARVGLESGDLIVRVDADVVPDMHTLIAQIRTRQPTQPVTIGFWRDGRYRAVTAPLAPLPRRLR
jgi:membrane-associated protease RseP (regulator of RpoE activity)